MREIVLVALGGATGSVLRYLISLTTPQLIKLPVVTGTLVVNLLGCLFIGFLFQWLEYKQVADTSLRLLLLTGLMGGFTTYSSFGLEGVHLLQVSWFKFGLYTGLHFIGGFCFVWLGIHLSRWLLG